jgi:hypothetical protein
MRERSSYPTGDEKQDDERQSDDSTVSPAEQAKEREREMEESGEENAA